MILKDKVMTFRSRKQLHHYVAKNLPDKFSVWTSVTRRWFECDKGLFYCVYNTDSYILDRDFRFSYQCELELYEDK